MLVLVQRRRRYLSLQALAYNYLPRVPITARAISIFTILFSSANVHTTLQPKASHADGQRRST